VAIMDMKLLQVMIHEAKTKYDIQNDDQIEVRLINVMEELGEISNCHRRLVENRGEWDKEELLYRLKDAVGDTVIALSGYCQLMNLSMDACVNQAVQEVLSRWEKRVRFGDVAYGTNKTKDRPGSEDIQPEKASAIEKGSVSEKLSLRDRGDSRDDACEKCRGCGDNFASKRGGLSKFAERGGFPSVEPRE